MANEPVKKRIIGIDPGYAITGYGIIDKVGSRFDVVDYGVIETKSKTDFPVRLLAINDKIRFLIEQYKPDYMSIEELFMGHNHTTVIGTAQARGAVLVEAGRAGVEVFEFTPGQVKLAITGYGKAEKKQVQIMTRSIFGFGHYSCKYRCCVCRQSRIRLPVWPLRLSEAQRGICLIY